MAVVPDKQPDGQITWLFLKGRVQPLLQKYSDFQKSQISCIDPSPGPGGGALAIVTNVGTGCGGRGGAFDEQRQGGRRSRVVLTPHGWRQVRENEFFAGDGDKKS
jgi:hypothetical protein